MIRNGNFFLHANGLKTRGWRKNMPFQELGGDQDLKQRPGAARVADSAFY